MYPYEPPHADLSPAPPPMGVSAEAPASVKRATSCLVASTVLSGCLVLGPLARLWRLPANQSTLAGSLGVLLLGLITWKIASRRRWALWLLAILVFGWLLGSAVSFALVPKLLLAQFEALPGLLLVTSLIHTLLQGVALIYLLGSSSRAWFRAARGTEYDRR